MEIHHTCNFGLEQTNLKKYLVHKWTGEIQPLQSLGGIAVAALSELSLPPKDNLQEKAINLVVSFRVWKTCTKYA